MSEALGRYVAYAAPRGASRAAPAVGQPVEVLHLFKYFRPDFTGDGLYLEKLLPLLEHQGVRNDVAAVVTRPGGTPSRARRYRSGRPGGFNPLMLLWFLANAWRYDVVHFHAAIDRHFLYHLIAWTFRCRIVQSCTLEDGLDMLVHGYRPRFRAIVRRLCGLIDDVVAISPALYEDTLRVAPAPRVHFIPQGVSLPSRDALLRDAARAQYGFAPSDTVALFVGGLCPRKDVRFLVDNHPAELDSLHLILVGPDLDGPYVAALRAAIAASSAAPRIRIAGYMEDPSAAYRAADMFVFASHKEGCPNVVLEAMAYGLPVISRHLPDTTDALIDDGRTGLLFRTQAEYADAVRRLTADPAARQALGEAGHAAVSTAYDLQTIATRYATLYRKAA